MNWMRVLLMSVALAAQFAWAQLTVTSPSNNDLLGKTNQVKFIITGANAQARVVATATKDGDPSIKFATEGLFDPAADKSVQGSLDLNFDDTTPLGTYTLRVQYFSAGTQQSEITITGISIDVIEPKFKNAVPSNGAFVSQIVPIQAELEEQNIDKWRVRVNEKDIPNNSGSSNFIDVQWNTTSIQLDGTQTITIKVDDRARNSNTKTLTVTLDRLSPSISVKSPANTSYRPTAVIPVVIDITDQFGNSMVNTGVNVSLRSPDGQFLGLVARKSTRATDNGLQWVGRIRDTRKLPDKFKVVVTALDRAGNRAVTQEIVVTIAGR